MRTLFFLLILASFVTSCCTEEFVQTGRFELPAGERTLIPYSKGQQITFVHSNGYAFNFVVTGDTVEWRTYYDLCGGRCCVQGYFTYQVKKTTLESEYPHLNVTLYLGGAETGYYHPMLLSLGINHRHFASMQYDSSLKFLCDTALKATCYDSVQLGNRMYYDVYEKQFDSHFFITDSSLLVPASILYNKLGLIQIKMSNNETYTLK